MRGLKFIVLGIGLGVLVGLWFGYNLGRDRPVLSNPFGDPALQQRAKDTAQDALDDSKRALRDKLAE